MKSNILLSAALSFSLNLNSANADDTSAPNAAITLEDLKKIVSEELEPVLNNNLSKVIQELKDNKPTELIEVTKLNIDHLVDNDYQHHPQLVSLDNIDTGPNRIIKVKLGSVKPEKKKFKN
ncbi:hypothetical protein HOJ01_01220 [bacterium]|jgi:hypothetical protein|nr:hypothetical protein [bacterium]MBT6293410.1 hypothetical protein [bacterium]